MSILYQSDPSFSTGKYAAWIRRDRKEFRAALATTTPNDPLFHQLQDIHGEHSWRFTSWKLKGICIFRTTSSSRSCATKVICPRSTYLCTTFGSWLSFSKFDRHSFINCRWIWVYHRSVDDLNEFTDILHPRKYCCRSIVMWVICTNSSSVSRIAVHP